MRPEQGTAKRRTALVKKLQGQSFVHGKRRPDLSFFRPAFVVYFNRHTMCWRSNSQYIHDETFVITLHRKVHHPSIFRTPMPVQYIFSVAVPVEFHFLP